MNLSHFFKPRVDKGLKIAFRDITRPAKECGRKNSSLISKIKDIVVYWGKRVSFYLFFSLTVCTSIMLPLVAMGVNVPRWIFGLVGGLAGAAGTFVYDLLFGID